MIYIEKGLRPIDWDKLENALELLRNSEGTVITVECPWCRGKVKVRMPIVAKEADIEAFKKLLQMGKEYLDEKNLLEKVLERIVAELERKGTSKEEIEKIKSKMAL